MGILLKFAQIIAAQHLDVPPKNSLCRTFPRLTTLSVQMSTPNPNIGRAPPSVEEGDSALPAVCRHQQQQSATAAAAEEAAPSLPVQTVTDCAQTSSVPQQVIVRQRPAVPPKPQLDVVRFSMAQARGSSIVEL